jgi:hypothetical protein
MFVRRLAYRISQNYGKRIRNCRISVQVSNNGHMLLNTGASPRVLSSHPRIYGGQNDSGIELAVQWITFSFRRSQVRFWVKSLTDVFMVFPQPFKK